MRKWMGVLFGVAAALAAVPSVNALAGNGYSVAVGASSPVASGHSFMVKAHGSAAQKALLYVYLDRKRCRSTWAAEAQRINITTYKPGQSHFVRGGDPRRGGFAYAWVSGAFKKSFRAQAGTTAGHEHVCGYLTTPNSHGGYQITAAHGAAPYTVQ